MAHSKMAKQGLPKGLTWLADSPLFIDDEQVGRFYDAVVRPEKEEDSTTLVVTQEKAGQISAKLGLEAELSTNQLFELLTTFLPFLKAKGSVQAEGGLEGAIKKETSKTIELHTIKTAQRQLEQLTLHYLVNLQGRLFIVDDLADSEWRKEESIAPAPRGVVFLNLPAGVKLIPTAAEFENGKIELIYERLLSRDGRQKAPSYPELERFPDPTIRQQELKAYWQWFEENFSSTKAMVAVEEAAQENGRLRWIDYRLPVTSAGDTVHLHAAPGGRYDTGVFAYNFVKRGYKHGLRIVGTLKTEPDVNILAIYDK